MFGIDEFLAPGSELTDDAVIANASQFLHDLPDEEHFRLNEVIAGMMSGEPVWNADDAKVLGHLLWVSMPLLQIPEGRRPESAAV